MSPTQNPKSKIRNPREIRRPKSEKLPAAAASAWCSFGFRISAFLRISAFGFRIFSSLLLLTLATTALGQARYLPRYQEPEWLTFHITELSTGLYAEGTHDETSYKNSNTSVAHDYFFFGPSLGFVADGSIYHPNLLTYYINSDGALGYGHDSFNSTTAFSRDEFQYLGRFSASINLLENKPYHAAAYANYDHTFRDNDFFSRVTVDSWRYGARASWQLGPWTLTADYFHRDEESSSPFPLTEVDTVNTVVNGTNMVAFRTNRVTLDQKIISHEDTVTVGARNERSSGGTTLNYSWDRYTRVDAGRLGEGNDHTVAAGDSERFGEHDCFKLNSTLSYSRREAPDELNNEIIGYATLAVEHRPNLSSFYDFNYDHFDTGSFNSDNYAGQISLSHQLFESLASTLTARASDNEYSDAASAGFTRRYGGGLSENYTKLITDTSRARVSNSVFAEHTDQDNSGLFTSVKNERHTFSEAGAPPNSFYLDRPNVATFTIVVTDLNHTQPGFLEGFDYRITHLGSRTLLERPLGSRIPLNAAVLVDYEADPSPPGSYETFTDVFQVRFELWKNLLGLYARVSLSRNNAPRELRVQDITAYAVGTDLTWRWFRAGAEYELYYSTESDYRAARLFQSVAFHADEASSLSFDLTETWVDYINVHRQEQAYEFITRYHRAFSNRLGFDADAGIAFRRGNGVDQTLATIRPSIKYVIGKTAIDAGYDYEYELFLNNEERQKHLFSVRVKRTF